MLRLHASWDGPGRATHGQGARLLLVLLLALAASSCGGKGSRTTGPTSTPRNARVVAIGDSITEGNRAGETSWPALLQGLLRQRNPTAEVIDRGVGGQKTRGGLATLATALAGDQPGFVTILEGTNDVDGGVPADQVAENLRSMVRLCRNSGAIPVLGTIPRQLGRRAGFSDAVLELNDRILQVATQEGVVVADVYAALPDESFFDADGLHPSDRGDAAIAATFAGALSRAGYPSALRARR